MKRLWIAAMILALFTGACGGGGEPGGTGDLAPTVTEAAPTEEPDAAEASAPEPEAQTPAPAPDEPDDGEPTGADEAEPVGSVRVPLDIVDPGDAGNGITRPTSSGPAPEGWTETEYLFGGSAVSYIEQDDLAADGFWEAVEGPAASYRTRMLVRRPPEAEFSGTVLVEWFNVTSGADIGPDWTFLSEEIARSGHAWIGVSAQAVGVNGQEGQFVGGGLLDTRGLRAIDPERYGSLEHPGDAFSFDIFTQVGVAVAGTDGSDVLGGLVPERVVALGESQSAGFMTTYVNAVHPLTRVYDGFLIHSRGSFGPAPSGDQLSSEQAAVKVRTDLDEPVFIFETETDLIGLGYAAARQDDSANVHTWEVAGTAHADVYTIVAGAGLPRDPAIGALIGCQTPINDGPQHETLQAALRHLVEWVSNGVTPPASPRIEIEDGAIVRDRLGIAVGGIRTPPVDAPLRVLSGDPGGDGGACFLFGTTRELDPATLASLYPEAGSYAEALEASATAAVDAGWLLPEDAEGMVAEETSRAEALSLN